MSDVKIVVNQDAVKQLVERLAHTLADNMPGAYDRGFASKSGDARVDLPVFIGNVLTNFAMHAFTKLVQMYEHEGIVDRATALAMQSQLAVVAEALGQKLVTTVALALGLQGMVITETLDQSEQN